MEVGRNVKISRRAILDLSINPKGIHIGNNVIISGNVIVLSHDHLRGIKEDTFIGDNVFVGNGSMILPGIHIGNHVAIGAGSVVTKDIPSHCIAAGNPAQIIYSGTIISDDCQLINKGNRISNINN